MADLAALQRRPVDADPAVTRAPPVRGHVQRAVVREDAVDALWRRAVHAAQPTTRASLGGRRSADSAHFRREAARNAAQNSAIVHPSTPSSAKASTAAGSNWVPALRRISSTASSTDHFSL